MNKLLLACALAPLVASACAGKGFRGPPPGYALWRNLPPEHATPEPSASRPPPPIPFPESVAAWWLEESPCPDGAKLLGGPPPDDAEVGCVDERGNRHGRWTRWSDDGHELLVTEFRDGKQHGRRAEYAWWGKGEEPRSWKLVKETHFADDLRHGSFRLDFDEFVVEGEYRLDKEHGTWTSRDRHENLLGRAELIDGERHGTETEWYEPGVVKKEETGWHEGKRHGTHTEWYPNGQIEEVREYLHGEEHGPFQSFYESGQRECAGAYEHGRRAGDWSCWHENGQKRSESFRSETSRAGVWQRWHDNGQLAFRGEFANDQPVGAHQTWDAAGVERTRVEYQVGVRHGVARTWDRDGDLLKEEQWQNDELTDASLSDCEARVRELTQRWEAVRHTLQYPPPPTLEVPVLHRDHTTELYESNHRLVVGADFLFLELDGERFDGPTRIDDAAAAVAALHPTDPDLPPRPRGRLTVQIWAEPTAPLAELVAFVERAMTGTWYLALVAKKSEMPPTVAAPPASFEIDELTRQLEEADEALAKELLTRAYLRAAGKCEPAAASLEHATDTLSGRWAYTWVAEALPRAARECGCKQMDLDTLEQLTLLRQARYDEPYFHLVPFELPIEGALRNRLQPDATVADLLRTQLELERELEREPGADGEQS